MAETVGKRLFWSCISSPKHISWFALVVVGVHSSTPFMPRLVAAVHHDPRGRPPSERPFGAFSVYLLVARTLFDRLR